MTDGANGQHDYLKHALDELVDFVLAVTGITTLHEVHELALEAAVGGGELERPEEVVSLLEAGSDGEDLVDQVLHARDTELAEGAVDDLVVSEGHTRLVDLSEATLVHQRAHSLQVGVTVGDVRLNEAEHVDGGLVQLDEDTIVDLTQAEQLQDLAGLRGHTDDTADADDKGDLGLGLVVELLVLLGLAAVADLVVLESTVLLHVLLGALEGLLLQVALVLTALVGRLLARLSERLVAALLLELGLRAAVGEIKA